MIGLKENVIIGKLIPAGTGMKRYRNTRLSTGETPEVSYDVDYYTGEETASFEEDVELSDAELDAEELAAEVDAVDFEEEEAVITEE